MWLWLQGRVVQGGRVVCDGGGRGPREVASTRHTDACKDRTGVGVGLGQGIVMVRMIH